MAVSLANLNQSTIRRILLSIDALNESERLTIPLDSNPFNLMRSVLMADFALELAAPIVCETLNLQVDNPKKGDTPYLKTYINSIRNHYSKLKNIDYLSNRILTLHDNRNRIQHSGVSFDRDSSYRMYSDAKDYIDSIFLETFGANSGSVSVTLSVNSEEVRLLIDNSISLRERGDLKEAIRNLAIAYAKSEDFLMGQATDITGFNWDEVQKMRSGLISTSILNVLNNRGFGPELDHRIRNPIEQIAEILQLQQLGLENSEIALFANRLPKAERSPYSTVYFLLGDEDNYSNDEVKLLTDIVLKAIWRMQNLTLPKS